MNHRSFKHLLTLTACLIPANNLFALRADQIKGNKKTGTVIYDVNKPINQQQQQPTWLEKTANTATKYCSCFLGSLKKGWNGTKKRSLQFVENQEYKNKEFYIPATISTITLLTIACNWDICAPWLKVWNWKLWSNLKFWNKKIEKTNKKKTQKKETLEQKIKDRIESQNNPDLSKRFENVKSFILNNKTFENAYNRCKNEDPEITNKPLIKYLENQVKLLEIINAERDAKADIAIDNEIFQEIWQKSFITTMNLEPKEQLEKQLIDSTIKECIEKYFEKSQDNRIKKQNNEKKLLDTLKNAVPKAIKKAINDKELEPFVDNNQFLFEIAYQIIQENNEKTVTETYKRILSRQIKFLKLMQKEEPNLTIDDIDIQDVFSTYDQELINMSTDEDKLIDKLTTLFLDLRKNNKKQVEIKKDTNLNNNNLEENNENLTVNNNNQEKDEDTDDTEINYEWNPEDEKNKEQTQNITERDEEASAEETDDSELDSDTEDEDPSLFIDNNPALLELADKLVKELKESDLSTVFGTMQCKLFLQRQIALLEIVQKTLPNLTIDNTAFQQTCREMEKELTQIFTDKYNGTNLLVDFMNKLAAKDSTQKTVVEKISSDRENESSSEDDFPVELFANQSEDEHEKNKNIDKQNDKQIVETKDEKTNQEQNNKELEEIVNDVQENLGVNEQELLKKHDENEQLKKELDELKTNKETNTTDNQKEQNNTNENSEQIQEEIYNDNIKENLQEIL